MTVPRLRYGRIGSPEGVVLEDETGADALEVVSGGARSRFLDRGGREHNALGAELVIAGGVVTNAREVLQAAIDRAATDIVRVVTVPGLTWQLDGKLNLADSGVTLGFEEGAAVTLAPGYADDRIIDISAAKVRVRGAVEIDGTNLQEASSPFDGTGLPVGLGIAVQGEELAPVQGVEISGPRISNCPASGIGARYTSGLRVSHVVASDCAEQDTMNPLGAIALMHCSAPILYDLRIYDSGLKGLYFSNCSGGSASQAHITTINEGHAGLFSANCRDMTFTQFAIEGTGAGVKHDRATNVSTSLTVVRGGSFLVQGGFDVSFTDCVADEPPSWGFLADAHPTYNSDLIGVTFRNCAVKRAPDTYSSTQRAFGVQSRTGLTVDDVRLIDCTVDGAYHAVTTYFNSQGTIGTLETRGGSYRNTENSALILRATDVKASGVRVADNRAGFAIQISNAGDPGRSLDLTDYQIQNPSGQGVNLISGSAFDSVKISGGQVDGATESIVLNVAAVKKLAVTKNQIDNNSGATAIRVIADTSAVTVAEISGNQLPDNRITFTNPDNVVGYMDGNETSTFQSVRPRQVKPYRGTGDPNGVVTAWVGDTYLRTDGGAGSTLYIKESGNGNATGWAAK